MLFLCYAQCPSYLLCIVFFGFRYLATWHQVWFMYHGYDGEVIGHGILWHYDGSFGLLLGHFTYFFTRACPSVNGSTYCPHHLGMLDFDRSYHCHLLSKKWSSYFFRFNDNMLRLTFFLSNWHYQTPKFYYLGCLFSSAPPLKILWYSCILTYKFLWWITYTNKSLSHF
jgi:hypothetical protein